MRPVIENAQEFDPLNTTSQRWQPMQASFGAGGFVLTGTQPAPGVIYLNPSAAGNFTLPPITAAAGNVNTAGTGPAVPMEGRSIKFYNVASGAFTATLVPATGESAPANAIIGTATVAQNATAIATVVNGQWRMG
jgi:hypothetical protein